MAEIAIIYHSGYGHTKKVAEHVARGAAAVDGVEAKLFAVEELADSLSPLKSADAMVFGSPTYMGGVSAPFKAFMDATSNLWMQRRWKDKIAAGFTNSGSLSGDKLAVLQHLAIFAAQHGMIWVGQAEMPTLTMEPGQPSHINRVGGFLGLMAQSNNAPADQTPPEGDLKTAEMFGKRVAETTRRWLAGKAG